VVVVVAATDDGGAAVVGVPSVVVEPPDVPTTDPGAEAVDGGDVSVPGDPGRPTGPTSRSLEHPTTTIARASKAPPLIRCRAAIPTVAVSQISACRRSQPVRS
jgi:hypothetical protein